MSLLWRISGKSASGQGCLHRLDKLGCGVVYSAVLWPYRLAVRTPGSHPGNPGSIPGRVTKATNGPIKKTVCDFAWLDN